MHEKVFSRNALEHLFAIELSGMLKMLSEFPTNHQIVEQLFVRQKMRGGILNEAGNVSNE